MASPDRDSPVPPPQSVGSDKSNKRDKRWSNSSHASNVPTTLVLKSQDQMRTDTACPEDSMFGVESLQDTVSAADRLDAQHQSTGDDVVTARDSRLDGPLLTMPTSFNTREQLEYASAMLTYRPPSLARATHLYQPPALDSGPLSTPKSASMRSFRLSDDDYSADESSSQALASSDEGDAEDDHAGGNDSDSPALQAAPQLVMPSIRMPARRPFTENGKLIGKLKIMVVGAAGTGKTSLIRSIVHSCEDIVHVDPLNNNGLHLYATSTEAQDRRHSGSSEKAGRLAQPLTEIQASTRAYPTWWHEIDDSRVLKRGKSNSETVLERNISFIDTPGYNDRLSFESYSANIINHIHSHLHRNAALASLNESEILGILSGNGGFQVDLVVYMLSGMDLIPITGHNGPAYKVSADTPSDEELALMRQLAQLVNLIPVLGSADLHSSETIEAKRSETAKALKAAEVSVFDLRQHTPHDMPPGDVHTPFSVSCASSRDDENMDASLLMSSGYVPPLEPSHLSGLVKAIFEPDMAACLRHSASRKYLVWHRSFSIHAPSMSLHSLRPGKLEARTLSSPPAAKHVERTQSSLDSGRYSEELSDASAAASPETGLVARSRASSPLFPLMTTTNAYALARITDHTQREERLAQAHLARWALDLQRALRNERARFAAIQQAERQGWLRERLEECVSIEACKEGKTGSNAIVLRDDEDQMSRLRHRETGMLVNAQDPMGLLQLQELLSRRGLLLARVVGGAGMVGAIVVWVMRAWGFDMEAALSGGISWRGSWSWTSDG